MIKNKMTKEEYVKSLVHNGINLLNELKPGWKELIDINTLNMVSPEHCIVGQIYGDYIKGLTELCIDDYKEECNHAFNTGFIFNEEDEFVSYTLLKELWIEELTK